LVASSSREDLGFASRNDGVAGNELGENTTSGFNPKSKRVNVNEHQAGVFFSTGKDATFNSSTISDSFVRIDTFSGFLAAKIFLQELLNLGDTSGTTDKDDFADGLVRVLENLLNRLHDFPEEVHIQLFELGPSQSFGEVVAILKAFDLDTGALLAGKCPLGFLDLTLKFAETRSTKFLREISASLLLVLLDQILHDPVVEVFTSKMSDTSGSQDFKDAVVDRKERNIKGTATKIIDDNLGLVTFLV